MIGGGNRRWSAEDPDYVRVRVYRSEAELERLRGESRATDSYAGRARQVDAFLRAAVA